MIDRLCIIGVGLIGGSLARALRNAGMCREIVGVGRQVQRLEGARALGVIDRYETDVAQGVKGADMVVVAVPLGAMQGQFQALQGYLAPDAVITDVGSAKRSVIAAARAAFGQIPSNLVPGHPIAGIEKSGVEASFAGLFEGHRVILTPVSETSAGALRRVRDMWIATGAEVVAMPPAVHDEVLAATSHLPHVLAYTLVDVLGTMNERVEIFRNAAGGFQDFSRIASSDPQMWHDICLANGDAIVAVLRQMMLALDQVAVAIAGQDGDTLKALFVRAKALRDQYTAAP
ncbi:MAG: prephenate dehydrogenase/arogenate dehydrogenase family protein [Gammaproteobacteria bacterium]